MNFRAGEVATLPPDTQLPSCRWYSVSPESLIRVMDLVHKLHRLHLLQISILTV